MEGRGPEWWDSWATRPASSNCFKDERAEKEARACATGCSVMEEGLARLQALKNSVEVPASSGPNGRAKGAVDGEVPRLCLP